MRHFATYFGFAKHQTLGLLALAGFVLACGSSDNKESNPLPVVGTVVVANAAAAGDNGSLAFDRATCSRDGNAIFTAALSNSSGLEGLKVQIRNFQTTNENTYACRQATDNKTYGSVGGRFDNCMVELKKKDLEIPTTANTFALYRDIPEMSGFTYEGNCELSVSYAAPKVDVKIGCTKLIKTYHQGGRANPVSTAAVLDVGPGSSFTCNLD